MLHFGVSVDSLQARRVITFVVGSGAATTTILISVGHQFSFFESSGASFVWADGSVMYEQGQREFWARTSSSDTDRHASLEGRAE